LFVNGELATDTGNYRIKELDTSDLSVGAGQMKIRQTSSFRLIDDSRIYNFIQ
jgi:hypothetical protein